MSLTFRDGTRRNAPRVPEEQWNQHKELLCSLYREKTVSEILKIMKDGHNFSPTGQLVGKLNEWGLHKYVSKYQSQPQLPAFPGEAMDIDERTSSSPAQDMLQKRCRMENLQATGSGADVSPSLSEATLSSLTNEHLSSTENGCLDNTQKKYIISWVTITMKSELDALECHLTAINKFESRLLELDLRTEANSAQFWWNVIDLCTEVDSWKWHMDALSECLGRIWSFLNHVADLLEQGISLTDQELAQLNMLSQTSGNDMTNHCDGLPEITSYTNTKRDYHEARQMSSDSASRSSLTGFRSMKSLSHRIRNKQLPCFETEKPEVNIPSQVMRRSSFCSSDFRLLKGLGEQSLAEAGSEARSMQTDSLIQLESSVDCVEAECQDLVARSLERLIQALMTVSTTTTAGKPTLVMGLKIMDVWEKFLKVLLERGTQDTRIQYELATTSYLLNVRRYLVRKFD